MTDILGLRFDVPAGFQTDEVMLTLKGPEVDLKDPRMMQKQQPVRANLIIHRRSVGGSPALDMLCGEICAELISGVEGIQNLKTDTFQFADGTAGRQVSFDFAVKHGAVRQFQVMRLDGAMFTTLTLTVDPSHLNERTQEAYFKALASVAAP